MLERCKESVCAQTLLRSPHPSPLPAGEGVGELIQHLVVVDEVGVGIAGMFAEIGRHVDEMMGEYVYVLQDDDELADERVVADLARFIWAGEDCFVAKGAPRNDVDRGPDVVMVRNIKRGLNLPLIWQEKPREGYVDLGSYVTRRGVFTENVTRFGKRYAGDFDFIDALWEGGYSFAWFDRLFARAQVREPGLGRPEKELV